MAILNTLIDKNAGNTLTAFTLTTFSHSVPTTPDLTMVNNRSVPSNTAISYAVAVGANASLATVLAPSCLGAGAELFDVWNIFFHSVVR